MSQYALQINNRWHTSPYITVTGTLYFSRNNERDPNISVSGTLTNTLNGYKYGTGYEDDITIECGGSEVVWFDSGKGYNDSYRQGATWSGSVNTAFTCTNNSYDIVVYIHCHYMGGGCPDGHSKVEIGRFNASAIPYNPYTAPQTYKITSFNLIKKLVDNRSLTYTISGGTGKIDWVTAQIYPDSQTWTAGKYSDVSQAVKNTKVYESSKFFTGGSSTSVNRTDTINLNNYAQVGKKYKLAIRFSDGSYEWLSSSDKTIYVYQQPTLNTTVTGYSNPASANKNNTFTLSNLNNRAFTDNALEQVFKTQYCVNSNGGSTYGSWVDLDTSTISGTSKTYTFNASTIRSIFPYSTSDGKSCKIKFRRYSPSSQLASSEAVATFTLYYKPRQGVQNITLNKNSSSGTSITQGATVLNNSELTDIYVAWSGYDATTVNAGITSGYRIRIYDKDDNVTYTVHTSNKFITIPKSNIPKLQSTKIDITPYYDNSGTYIYYDTATPTKFNFVKLVGLLDTPVITYPVNNSNWINTMARICFQLPIDQDVVNGTIPYSSYNYENIEIKVNNKIYTLNSGTYGASTNVIVAPEIFSYSTLLYREKEVIVPNVTATLPLIVGSNTVSVRVKKNKYTIDEGTYLWSEWSPTVTFFITIPSYSPSDGNSDPNLKYIRASHYNNIISVVERAAGTYGINWTTDTAQANMTVIQQNQFKYDTQTRLFQTIYLIKYVVNTYAVYDQDKQSLKFDTNNVVVDNFTTYKELVTELAESSGWTSQNPTGRNYLQIAFDRVTALR